MYQPKIKNDLIRKRYFLAKKEKEKMTQLINEIVEEYLCTEPDSPPYEPSQRRVETTPNTLARKMKAYAKLLREYYGAVDDTQAHERAAEMRGEAHVQPLAESPPDRRDPV